MDNILLPILYSFRRCPFAMRARWALLEAGLIVQWREVALKAKPAALLEASSKGTVPVMVLADGTVLDESMEIMRWALNQADPRQLQLTSGSQSLVDENDGPFKHHLDRFKYTDRYPGACIDDHQQAGLAILRRWNERLSKDDWLLGHRVSLADAALWPFVRQWRLADPTIFEKDTSLDALRIWLERFLNDPSFERLMQRADPWDAGGLQPRFPADASAVPCNQPLFHLALKNDWHLAQARGSYVVSTRGLTLEQVGFIHCSWEEQVPLTHERFYSDAGEVLLLRIDPSNLTAPLRADAGPDGDLFPHLYGPLPLNAVETATPYP